MSQARVRTFQTAKSVNYLYKVCKSGTNASRSYCSISSFKAPPFVKEISTLSSAAPDVSFNFRNPNEFPATGENSIRYGKNWSYKEIKSDNGENSYSAFGGNYMAIQRNHGGAYAQSYYHNGYDQYKILEHSSNRSYEEGRNVQSSYRMNSGIAEKVTGGGNDQYLEDNVVFQENQGNLQCQNQYEGNSYGENSYGVYEGNYMGIQRNQENQGNLQCQNQYNVNGTYNGMLNPQLPGYSQPNEMPYEAVDERQFLGTIENLDDFCKHGKLKEAVRVLGFLEQNNVTVDIPRYLILMKACGESQALTEAKQVHNHLTRSVPHLDVFIYNKILEMYSKCGSMKDAYKVFDKMPQRNLTSWDTMITWLAKNGHGEDAIEMFTEFKRVGLKPDNQIFFGVFIACSVLGDMREGLLHFESMIKTYNLVPTMDHYARVVDMLASAGYLNEALEFIEKMTIEPGVQIWEIMMNQSRVHGDLPLGDRFAEIVNLLDPSRLTDQSKEGLIPIKPSDIQKGKGKKNLSFDIPPDNATKVCEYRAGDTSHADHAIVYSQLRCLKQAMKEAGYVAETRFALHDVDQESKEDNLFGHSERLALSRALLTSPPRALIRIIKNLRACVDCHNAFKVISKLVGREIVARDAKRFHLFKNGECSCGDYW